MRDEAFKLLNQHITISPEVFERLSRYHDLLVKWQAKINLVGPDTIGDAWRRHFLDSLQLLPHIDRRAIIVDIGSGAGFPGMALAVAGVENIHLIESDAKKIAFLKEVARVTDTKVFIHHMRIEKHPVLKADLILSRACSSLDQLLEYSHPSVSHETICLFHKGKNYFQEVVDAKQKWIFDEKVISSVTDTQGVILKITHLKEVI